MSILKVVPYSVITKAIEKECLEGEHPWFETREEFEEWAGDIVDGIAMEILDTLEIEYDTEK